MAKKRIVLKVPIASQKCQTEIMKAVAKISGIEKMEIDENKGTLTIIGEVEPVPIFKKLKKIGKISEIISVGPPRPKCPPHCTCSLCRPYYVQCSPPRHPCYPPSYAKPCELIAVEYPSSCDGPAQCTIV